MLTTTTNISNLRGRARFWERIAGLGVQIAGGGEIFLAAGGEMCYSKGRKRESHRSGSTPQ